MPHMTQETCIIAPSYLDEYLESSVHSAWHRAQNNLLIATEWKV
jgi:hypothetical protein